jgi:hypothetical protein
MDAVDGNRKDTLSVSTTQQQPGHFAVPALPLFRILYPVSQQPDGHVRSGLVQAGMLVASGTTPAGHFARLSSKLAKSGMPFANELNG